MVRVRKTYFFDSRFFIGIANIAFNIILLQDLVSDLFGVLTSQLLFVAAIVVTTVSIGFASYLLENSPESSGFSELKKFLTKPPKAFLGYLSIIAGWGTLGFVFEPWGVEQSLNDPNVLYYAYQTWYLVLSSLLLGAYLLLPVAHLYRQSRALTDSKAARSLKIISLSWTGFGVASLLQVALPYTQAIGDIVEGLLFALVAFALKEPTVLSRIMSSRSSLTKTVLLPRLNQRDRVVDQPVRQDYFSSLFGFDHNGTSQCRLLLEFDPSAVYEDIVGKFVEEAQAYGEPVAVFTSIGSPVRRRLGNRPDFNLFSFSSKTSTSSRRSDGEVLLPERESSLMLDAVDKLLQANKGRHISLVFDIFGDLATLQGFEKAYGVLSSVLEMAESESATTLVLLNQTAHDERVLSGVRGLFISQILCDANGTRLVRFQRPEVRGLDDEQIGLHEPTSHGVGGN